MAADNNQPPGLGTLVGRLARTGLGAVHNRFELLAIEWQEERARLSELLIWTVALLFFAVLGTLLLTATIILLFPQEARLYVTIGFTVLYLAGAVGAWFGLRSLLRREPFAESLEQARKDRAWLKSFE